MSRDSVAGGEGESVLVLMGANIDPAANLLRALAILAEALTVVAASRVFQTEPVADRPMPVFLNAALEIHTALEPMVLRNEVLRPVESRLGRKRSADRNAPRQIDLDLALYGDRIVVDRPSGIALPDPGILRFAHVAVPLADVAPRRRHPVTKQTLEEIAAGLGPHQGVRPAERSAALIDRLRSPGPTRGTPLAER